jgi:hypothetical protein
MCEQEDDFMRLYVFGFTVLAAAGLSSCIGTGRADRAASLIPRPVRPVTAEPGVVPAGTWLVIRANDGVNTQRAFRGTIYDASVAEDVLDQNGSILIPKESPVELVVRSLSYLGPGGVGMTELTLGVHAVSVNGVRYPVVTETEEPPNAGGLGVDRHAAKLIGGGEAAGQVLTVGSRISVPAETRLAFQIVDPIRLRGYRR